MNHRLLAIGLVTLAAVAVAADQPKLGPEWTEDKEAQHYFKMMQIKAVRSAGGNTRNYSLDLEHDKVRVTDTDGNIATSVHVNNTIELDLRKDPKGVPSKVTVAMNKSRYYDLNCDGEWDAWYDNRDGADRLFIWRDSQWFRVYDTRGAFRTGQQQATSLDRKTDYVWDGKVWNAKQANP